MEWPDPVVLKVSERTGIPVGDVKSTACSTCPFRLKNQGVESALIRATTHSSNWDYSATRGIRHGDPMVCHVGTPSSDPAGQMQSARTSDWVRNNPPALRPCVGALVVAERELVRYYRTGRLGPNSLSAKGLRRWLARLWSPAPTARAFRAMPRSHVLMAMHPALGDVEIGHPEACPQPGLSEFR